MNAKTNTAKTETVAPAVVTKTEVDLTKFGTPAALKAKHVHWSAVFRALSAEGLTTGQIAKVTEKRYQHVRNVLITPVKKTA